MKYVTFTLQVDSAKRRRAHFIAAIAALQENPMKWT